MGRYESVEKKLPPVTNSKYNSAISEAFIITYTHFEWLVVIYHNWVDKTAIKHLN